MSITCKRPRQPRNCALGYLTPNEFEVLHSTQPQATLSALRILTVRVNRAHRTTFEPRTRQLGLPA